MDSSCIPEKKRRLPVPVPKITLVMILTVSMLFISVSHQHPEAPGDARRHKVEQSRTMGFALLIICITRVPVSRAYLGYRD
jgi:hypothetical protein